MAWLCAAILALPAAAACSSDAAPARADTAVEVEDGVANVDATVDGALDAPEAAGVCDDVGLLEGDVGLGRNDDVLCFESLAGEDVVTITHGLQGGIHVELRLAVRAARAPSITFDIDLVADGTRLARFAADHATTLPRLAGSPDTFATPAVPVVFASSDASLYHGRLVDVVAHVTVDDVERPVGAIRVRLIDPGLQAVGR